MSIVRPASASFCVSLCLFVAALSFASGCLASDPDPEQVAGAAPDARRNGLSPNGVRLDEAQACDMLFDAQEALIQALGCVITRRICPSFLQAQNGLPCADYDEGTVQGCIARYNEQIDCDHLARSIDECAPTPYVSSGSPACH